MSGIYIPGIEMPKGCAFCKISRRNGKKMVCPFCFGQGEWDIHDPMSADHRLDGCPLVPVPAHGRLIDADALKKNAYPFPCAIGTEWATTLRQINDAPTIIPASTADKEGE